MILLIQEFLLSSFSQFIENLLYFLVLHLIALIKSFQFIWISTVHLFYFIFRLLCFIDILTGDFMIQQHVRQDLHSVILVCKFILSEYLFFMTNWIVFLMSWFFQWEFSFLLKESLFMKQGILFRIVVERWFRDSFLRVSLLHDFISILLKLVKKIIAWAFWKLAVLIPFKTDWFLSHLYVVYFYQSNWEKQLSFQESTQWGTTWII